MTLELGRFPDLPPGQAVRFQEMQCAEAVQRQQAKSLFHNVVTDLLVCQSLEVAVADDRSRLWLTRETVRFRGCKVPKQSNDNRLKAYSTTW